MTSDSEEREFGTVHSASMAPREARWSLAEAAEFAALKRFEFCRLLGGGNVTRGLGRLLAAEKKAEAHRPAEKQAGSAGKQPPAPAGADGASKSKTRKRREARQRQHAQSVARPGPVTPPRRPSGLAEQQHARPEESLAVAALADIGGAALVAACGPALEQARPASIDQLPPAPSDAPRQGEQASRMHKRAAERSPASSPAGAEAAGQLVLLAGDAVSFRPGGRAGLKQPRSLVYAPPMDHDPSEE